MLICIVLYCFIGFPLAIQVCKNVVLFFYIASFDQHVLNLRFFKAILLFFPMFRKLDSEVKAVHKTMYQVSLSIAPQPGESATC